MIANTAPTVAMRSVKAAIAHSMKMRDLINSNSPDYSLGDKGLVAGNGSRLYAIAAVYH
jgi:hypothetical protein